MKLNEISKDEILQIVNNQISSNNPPETKITYKRLVSLGYNDFETKQLIGKCISVEISNVIKSQKPYNESRYINSLKQLPKEPLEL